MGRGKEEIDTSLVTAMKQWLTDVKCWNIPNHSKIQFRCWETAFKMPDAIWDEHSLSGLHKLFQPIRELSLLGSYSPHWLHKAVWIKGVNYKT